MAEWDVHVCRTGYAHATIRVEAETDGQAMRKAEDEAGDHSYSEKTAEYEAMGATQVPEPEPIPKVLTLKEGDSIPWQSGGVRVTVEFIGEGLSGDWNPDDPNDQPLLRFSVEDGLSGEWEAVRRGSYCTQIPATTPRRLIIETAGYIWSKVAPFIWRREGIKQICEELSWLEVVDGQLYDPKRKTLIATADPETAS